MVVSQVVRADRLSVLAQGSQSHFLSHHLQVLGQALLRVVPRELRDGRDVDAFVIRHDDAMHDGVLSKYFQQLVGLQRPTCLVPVDVIGQPPDGWRYPYLVDFAQSEPLVIHLVAPWLNVGCKGGSHPHLIVDQIAGRFGEPFERRITSLAGYLRSLSKLLLFRLYRCLHDFHLQVTQVGLQTFSGAGLMVVQVGGVAELRLDLHLAPLLKLNLDGLADVGS